MSDHPDFAAEQDYLDRARVELDRAREEVRASFDWADQDRSDPDAMALAANLRARLYQLDTAGSYAPCFARLDDEDGEQLYIGRQHIADREQNPVVIDWRAPRAAAFYRATPLDPMGCVLRRQFILEDQDLVEIYDTDLSDPHASVGVPDPLLAEINRARTGRMREVVATIQVEQDEIVRAPREQPLFVQGGPGTGKTVVGLHRAAYLLYEHRDVLSKDGVLILGPNERFMEYISEVLPQLGERTVRQLTLSQLLAGRRRLPQSAGPHPFDRLRTGHRMAELISAALRSRAEPPDTDLRVRTRFGSASIAADRAAELMDDALGRYPTVGLARRNWIAGVVRELFRALPQRDRTSVSDYASEVRRADGFRGYVDRHWKADSEAEGFALVWRTLETRPDIAERCRFSEAERETLAAHRRAKPRDTLDLVVLDEVRAALGKRTPTHGHVVLDEAQDLTPLELRAVGRRVDKGSITVLGDLAQSTGLHTYPSWHRVAQLMAIDAHEPIVGQLSIGYRVPAEFVELANRLLPRMGADLAPTGFIRNAGRLPRFALLAAEQVTGTAMATARELAKSVHTVAVVAPAETVASLADPEPGIAVLTPAEAKGLEFEAVVVVDPAVMLAEEPSGPNQLFVALTRALQDLVLVGSTTLPGDLMAATAIE
ncbi:MAG: AAA family ATPase [Acidimicrobiia bacterium]|nr:AAA family ATPase [Acidimicrobiia bacterium]